MKNTSFIHMKTPRVQHIFLEIWYKWCLSFILLYNNYPKLSNLKCIISLFLWVIGVRVVVNKVVVGNLPDYIILIKNFF